MAVNGGRLGECIGEWLKAVMERKSNRVIQKVLRVTLSPIDWPILKFL